MKTYNCDLLTFIPLHLEDVCALSSDCFIGLPATVVIGFTMLFVFNWFYDT